MTVLEFDNEINKYVKFLREQEKSSNTIKKYKTDLYNFVCFCNKNNLSQIDKTNLIDYKIFLQSHFKISSINSYINSINNYLKWLNQSDLKLNYMKNPSKSNLNSYITVLEYKRMLEYAKILNKNKMYYLMKTLVNTGIRISELEYITAENVSLGRLEIINKGKIKTIFIPPKLKDELKQFCNSQNIKTGIIFHGRNKSQLINKTFIWRELKYIAGQAKIKKNKIHTQSFRYLFAVNYMQKVGNVANLYEILGQSTLGIIGVYSKSSERAKIQELSKIEL